MRKKKWDYILLLVIFLIFIFSSSIDGFLIAFNPNLNKDVILDNYNKSLEKEYNELLNYHNFNMESTLNLTISKVKYRDIYDFTENFTIYKGFKDNIAVGDAVMSDKGLIGVVSKTYEHSSVVRLITNKSSNISVKVGNSYGILKMSADSLIVSEVNNYENIAVGDEIYTSGIGNLPGDIYIGKVNDVKLKDNGIEKIVSVDAAVDFDCISYLFVLVR